MELYRNIMSIEPLLPESGIGKLLDLGAEIYRKSGEL
jgi:hypothetical protein